MKFVVVLIICFLAHLSFASFFDGVKEAVFTVEDNISKLLSDVITDVKETIDCSILAMEEALSFSGIFPKPIANSKCNKDSALPISPPGVQDDLHNSDVTKTSGELSVDTDLSLSQVNESFLNISSVDDSREKNKEELKNFKTLLEKEDNDLQEVSEMLKKEIEITSNKDYKTENLTKTEIPSLASMPSSLKKSREKEKSNNDISGAREQPKQGFEKVLDLNIEKKDGGSKDVKKYITEASTTANSTKPYNTTVIVDSSNVHHEENGAVINENHKQNEQRSTEPPKTIKTFKDITRLIMSTQTSTTKMPPLLHSTSRITSSSAVTPTQTTTKTPPSLNTDNNDYYSFLDVISSDEESNKKAIEQAQTIIENAVLTEQMMDNLHNENNGAVDVFANWF